MDTPRPTVTALMGSLSPDQQGDLASSAAGALARELAENWADCQEQGSPLSSMEKAGDLDEAITLLKEWRLEIVRAGDPVPKETK
jgi:hypothetical protein